MRVQGWDPVLLICQIISLQAIHYLTMSLILPPLVTLTNPTLLTYSGGPSTVGHILDWREMAARPAIPSSAFHGLLDFSAVEGWQRLRGAWAGGKQVGEVVEDREGEANSSDSGSEGTSHGGPARKPTRHEMEDWDLGVDDFRGWLIAFAWILASAIDIAPLYYLIRRPTHILDFSLTLTFIHLILTSYFAKAFPTSIFFWVVMASGAVMMITVAEQLCVKREMRTDLDLGWNPDDLNGEEIELGHVTR